MKILIACEYSGVVRNAFGALGHDVTSCDILPGEIDLFEPQYGHHYIGNVMDIINDSWDLMVGHPPCTYLSYAGAGSWNKPGRAQKRQDALDFFKNLWNSPAKKICLENPLSYASTWRRYDQIICPSEYGHRFQKRTCLWLKNLPPLQPTNIINNAIRAQSSKWFNRGGVNRQKIRSKTFSGIAQAMAEQWG